MHESDTEKWDVLSEFKSFCHLYKQKLQDVGISEFHKICDVLHFSEIREIGGICFKPGQPLYDIGLIITFCLSTVHLLNDVLANYNK